MDEYVSRFLFYVDVGQLPTKGASALIAKVKKEVNDKNFFPKDSVIFIPVREGGTRVDTFSFPKSQLY